MFTTVPAVVTPAAGAVTTVSVYVAGGVPALPTGTVIALPHHPESCTVNVADVFRAQYKHWPVRVLGAACCVRTDRRPRSWDT